MLVLSRVINERVFIDTPSGRIDVVIVEVRGDRVRLGFEAPRTFQIHRDNAKSLTPKERSDH